MSGAPGRHPGVVLDGASLRLDDLVAVARDPAVPLTCAPQAVERIERSARLIERIAETYREEFEAYQEAREKAEKGGVPCEAVRPLTDYGVTTGFGEFKDIPIAPDELEALQRNILLSHMVGVGESPDADDPANYYPPEVVRGALALRLNAVLKGYSGIRPAMVEAIHRMLARGVVPLVPLRGSVGASGDLCPLAHLFAVFVGAGRYVVATTAEEVARGLRGLEIRDPSELAGDLGLEGALPEPSFKEGLALTNGANFTASMLALAVYDAERAAAVADCAAALSLEALCGCGRALDPKVHRARGHRGQIDSAANLRALLEGSRLLDGAGAVQDAYSLRCAPQVHGASRDTIAYARMVVEAELNAATDNPLFFPGDGGEAHAEEPWDWRFQGNWPQGYDGRRKASYSAGNFHGQPLALAADFLAVAVAELADVSERRSQALLDAHHNRGLPGNLIPRRGVNSGLMIAQYCAAGIVSENKVLTHPASVDSIPTSANTEDHVSMSTHAARKLRSVVWNAQAVLAVELACAAQAVEWRAFMGYGTAGSEVPARDDEPGLAAEHERFSRAGEPAARQAVVDRLGRGTGAVYRAVRETAPPMCEDRPLDGDLRALCRLVAGHGLYREVAAAVPLRPIAALSASAPSASRP